MFKPRDVKIEDIQVFLANGGLLSLPDGAYDFAEENDAFKYIGYYNNYHRYTIGFQDEEEPEKYYVSIVLVWLGVNGDIVADFSGMPVFESTDPEKVLEYIEKRCN